MCPLTSHDLARTVPRPIPRFVPHPLVRGGHLQTIVGRYAGRRPSLRSTYHEVAADGGDRLSLLDAVPDGWQPGDPVAVLVHGLAGCVRSAYVVRVASRLWARGVRAVRMNLRGAGSGRGLARQVYHAGRTEDVRRVVEWAAARSPGSPIAMVGFSLGANLVLKLAAEAEERELPGFDCVLAANPPLDLAACCRAIQRPENRVYDRSFTRQLRRDVERLHRVFPDLGPVALPEGLTVYAFDEHYTARRNGFDGADDYYRKSSAAGFVPRIARPGLVVHAEDDPFIPIEPFRRVVFPENLRLEIVPGGGHLGYVSAGLWDGTRRWLDNRLTRWLAEHWRLGARPAVAHRE